jgi:hypothetical protein
VPIPSRKSAQCEEQLKGQIAEMQEQVKTQIAEMQEQVKTQIANVKWRNCGGFYFCPLLFAFCLLTFSSVL